MAILYENSGICIVKGGVFVEKLCANLFCLRYIMGGIRRCLFELYIYYVQFH